MWINTIEAVWNCGNNYRIVAILRHSLSTVIEHSFSIIVSLCSPEPTPNIVTDYSGTSLLRTFWEPEFLATFCYNIEVFLYHR